MQRASIHIDIATASPGIPLPATWPANDTMPWRSVRVRATSRDRLPGSNIIAGRSLVARANGGLSDYVTATRAELIVVL